MRLILKFCLTLSLLPIAARAQAPLQEWIDDAVKAGGGVVTVPPGEHVLPAGLLIKDAKKLALRGMEKERCVLKLPPLAYAECSAATSAGAGELPVRNSRGWKPGMRLHLEADGEVDSFTQKPRPYVLAVIREVEAGVLRLKEPLKFPIPEGTPIRHEDAPNLIEIRGACEGIEVANLVLDGGRMESDPPVQGHAQLCTLFVAGAYHYEKGPTGPKPKDITLRDCIVQNVFGRGAAFYSVEQPSVERCSFRDGCDEAIDFDHFTKGGRAVGNQIIRWRIAFEMNDVNDCLIEGNEARDCEIGLSLWRWCRQPGLNEGNTVHDNAFHAMRGNAVQVGTGTAKNRFEGNEIWNAGKNGISLHGEGQVLRGNVIQGSRMKPIVVQAGKHEIDVPVGN